MEDIEQISHGAESSDIPRALELVGDMLETHQFGEKMKFVSVWLEKLDCVRAMDLASVGSEENVIYTGPDAVDEAQNFLSNLMLAGGKDIRFVLPKPVIAGAEIDIVYMTLYGQLVDILLDKYQKTKESYGLLLTEQDQSQVEKEVARRMVNIIKATNGHPEIINREVLQSQSLFEATMEKLGLEKLSQGDDTVDFEHLRRDVRRRARTATTRIRRQTKNYLASLVRDADTLKQFWGSWMVQQFEAQHGLCMRFTGPNPTEADVLDMLQLEELLGDQAERAQEMLDLWGVESHRLEGLQRIIGRPLATMLEEVAQLPQEPVAEEIVLPAEETKPAHQTLAAYKLIGLIESGGHRLSKKEGKERDRATRKLANDLHRAGIERPVAGLMVALGQNHCEDLLSALKYIDSLPDQSRQDMGNWDPQAARTVQLFDPRSTARTVVAMLQSPAEYPELHNIFSLAQRNNIIEAAQRVRDWLALEAKQA